MTLMVPMRLFDKIANENTDAQNMIDWNIEDVLLDARRHLKDTLNTKEVIITREPRVRYVNYHATDDEAILTLEES